MARTQSDAFEEVIRRAAEIEYDEGNPKEIFDRIGLRPFLNLELEKLGREREEENFAKTSILRVQPSGHFSTCPAIAAKEYAIWLKKNGIEL
jgi:hypothetical protein